MPDNRNSFGMQIAQSAGGGILGIGLGALGGLIQNAQQEHMMGLQEAGNKRMMDYSYQKQLQMWKDTNYWAQVQELKKAGLNPGLLYGMGGAGGTTTGGGTPSVGQGSAINPAGMGIQMANNAAQLGLLKAQKENIEADTANKRADIPVKETTVGKTKEETIGIQLNNEFLQKTMKDRVDIINSQMGQQMYKLEMDERANLIDKRTMEFKINIARAQAIGEVLKNGLIEAQTKQAGQNIEESKKKVELMSKEIEEISNKIMQEWTRLEQTGRETDLKGIQAIIDQLYKANTVFGVPVQNHNTAEMAEYIREVMKQRPIMKK